MLDEVRSLLALQELDRRIIALDQDLEKMPQQEARARNKLAEDEKAVANAKEAVNQGEMALKNLELDAETRKTSIARLKTQQFVGVPIDLHGAHLGNALEDYVAA
ncbi:MAG: hypothetical protein ACO3SO_04970 [Luteolibacter sp.]